ncbi:LisH/CRA/RING-U-box domains-containing protein [Striga hermonthica]|uniref:LisH/CRA/RING-U-box domains-containing protein n=1 Tax=Striga hermonthica TaxID=68872 RepID=A0A9N7N0I9_STRHE|nr:LisH/CRA/RING-U-box domains-containing protein [Striga hermonthica]
MELNSVKDAFDRVTKKEKLSSSKSQEMIQHVEAEIERTLSIIPSGQEDHRPILNALKAKLNDLAPQKQLAGTLKELNIALSKYQKLLEKSFIPDISKAFRKIDFDTHTVNQIIISHFHREGKFDLGDCFVEESEEPEAAAVHKSPFLEMFAILDAIKSRNLMPALTWAAANHEQLNKNGSDIELKLHRLQLVEILEKNGRDDALKHARAFLAPFASTHMSEVQKLMACLLWAGRLDQSPYTELLSPLHWDRLLDELARELCNLIGQSYESPLSVTVAAGVQGLPTLLKLMNVMMTGRKQEWQTMKVAGVCVPVTIFSVVKGVAPGIGMPIRMATAGLMGEEGREVAFSASDQSRRNVSKGDEEDEKWQRIDQPEK